MESLAWGCLVAVAATAAAPPPPSSEPSERQPVVLLPLERDGVDEVLAREVEDAIGSALGRLSHLKVISQAELRLLIAHVTQRQRLECDPETQACLAEIADVSAADQVLSGRIGKVADTIVINLTRTDARRAAVVGRVSEVAYAPAEAVEAAGRAALALFGHGGGERPRFRLAESEMRQIVMLDLQASGVDPGIAQNLTQVIAARLKQVEGLKVLTWDDLSSMMEMEQSRQLMGCEDQLACLTEIGGAMGADGLIAGHVGLLGGTYVIGLKLISPRTVEVRSRVTESFRGDVNQLIRAARYAAGELLGLPQEGTGRLEVEGPTREGEVVVAGVTHPLSAGRLDLPEGKHLVRIESPDFFPWASEVYIERGDLTRLDAALQERPVPWYRKWWVWTVAGVVVAGTAAAVGVAVATSGQDAPAVIDPDDTKTLERPQTAGGL